MTLSPSIHVEFGTVASCRCCKRLGHGGTDLLTGDSCFASLNRLPGRCHAIVAGARCRREVLDMPFLLCDKVSPQSVICLPWELSKAVPRLACCRVLRRL